MYLGEEIILPIHRAIAGQKLYLCHQIALLPVWEVAHLGSKAEMRSGDGQVGDGAAHAHVEGAVAGIDKRQGPA